jgi:Family of unknown function (DUF6084)
VTVPSPPVAAAEPALELRFAVEGAEALPYAAVPTIRFALRVESLGGQPVRSLSLDVQMQIAARRRGYGEAEQGALIELFGDPSRWKTTLRTLPWLRTTLVVPGFTGETLVDLDVPVTYDFEVTAAKYLQALEDGEVPLELLFSGTAFYATASGLLQAVRISWESEAGYRLPVRVWRETIDHYFPGSAWLRLSREAFERLRAHRARHALPNWDATIDSLLPPAGKDG